MGPAVLAFALMQFGVLGAASAQTSTTVTANSVEARKDTFGALKHVKAGLLNVAYAEVGPADGPVVILLHGWPYDIHSYSEVAPLLAAKGYRVLIPYARGMATRSSCPPRPCAMASLPRWRATSSTSWMP